MAKNHFLIPLLLVLISVFSVSCNKNLDVPPAVTSPYAPNMSISKLLSMHTQGNIEIIADSIFISGVVSTSDETGNCYKYIAIQDADGGIQIQINNSSLYNSYPIGQRVVVKCQGLTLSDYGGLPQLNYTENGETGRLPAHLEKKFIFLDNAIGKEPAPVIINSLADIKPKYYNMLVEIPSCYFAAPGMPYADPQINTNRDIVLPDGHIIMRTSGYATFANSLTPEGNVKIKALLTVFNNTLQLVIRSLDDVVAIPTENIFYQLDLTHNPLSNGWHTESIAGTASWQYNESASVLFIAGTEGIQNDNWLISSIIPINHTSVKLILKHRVLNNLGNNNNMKLYYTTTQLSSSFNIADWTELVLPETSFINHDIEKIINLPTSVTSSPNFRIAFRYIDNRLSSWYLSSVSLKGLSNANSKYEK